MKKNLQVTIEVEVTGTNERMMELHITGLMVTNLKHVISRILDSDEGGYESNGVLKEDGQEQQIWFNIVEI